MYRKILMLLFITAIIIAGNPDFSQSEIPQSEEIDALIEDEFQWLREEAEVTVTGVSKYEQNLMDVPATVSVIETGDFSDQIKTNIPELLRTVPGVTVYRNHGDSPWYRVSMRGLNDNFLSASTLVTIDGVPFFNPHGGGVDLSWLPMANLSRIEVIKGTFSTLYGANAFGGVINLVTRKKPDQDNNTSAGIQVFGRENIDNPSDEGIGVMGMVSHAGQTGALSYHLSADMLTDQGYRQNWQVTPSFMGPQSRIGLFSDDLEQDRGRFSWHVGIGDRFSFSGFYTRDQKDILGMNDDLDDQILHTALSFENASTNFYHYVLRLYYNQFDQVQEATETFRFAEDNPFPGAHLIGQPFYYDLAAFTIGGEFQNHFTYSDALRLVFGADFRNDASTLDVAYLNSKGELKPYGYSRKWVQDYGTYVQAEYHRNKLRVVPGIRYDYDSKSGGFMSGKMGISYRQNNNHSVYGVAGRGFRAPNFNDRFVNVFGKTGYEDLEPEKTWQFELGSKNSFLENRVRWNICAFYTITDDYIDTDEEKIYTNLEGLTAWGMETDGTWQISPNIRANAAFSAIIGEYDETGAEITIVPKHKWTVGLSYDDRQKWRANLMVRGESHKILGNPLEDHIRVGSYQVADISLSRKFELAKTRWTITLFAENLFDRRYVEAWPGAVSVEGGRSEGLTVGMRTFINF